MVKRAIDLLAAVAGLIVTLPIMLAAMLAVSLQDFRNPFYVAPRVGRGGVQFRMFKLRTMVVDADKIGGTSTAVTDRRITRVGRVLRQFKLDEVPQLLNVALGQMSLVGPRPQVPQLVAGYTSMEKRLLAVLPGITDFSSIVFADLGEILKDADDVDAKYDLIIRPWKSRLGLLYVRKHNLATDVCLIVLTVMSPIFRSLVLGAVQRLLAMHGAPSDVIHVAGRSEPLFPAPPPGAVGDQRRIDDDTMTTDSPRPPRDANEPTGLLAALQAYRRPPIIVAHLLVIGLSNYVAFILRFDGSIPPGHYRAFLESLPWLIAIRAFVFSPLRLYEGLWRYTSLHDLQKLVIGVLLSSVMFGAYVFSPVGPLVYPRTALVLDALILIVLLGGLRLIKRISSDFTLHVTNGRRVLVYGAGDAGEMVVREMRQSRHLGLRPVGFVDDDRRKVGASIHGVRVLGTSSQLGAVVAKTQASVVVVAIPGADPELVRKIVSIVEPYGVQIKTLPQGRSILAGVGQLEQIRSLTIEDLLRRRPINLDSEPIRTLLHRQRVMVTGAGGTIGAELCRQIAAFRPERLVMVERHSASLAAVRQSLTSADSPKTAVHGVLCDVTDEIGLSAIFSQHAPTIVFHAATHYSVDLAQAEPCEIVRNNIRGIRLVTELAARYGAKRVVMMSTDKAVNPANIVGATHRAAEMVARSLETEHTSVFVLRFGNILGAPGSVVPLFLDQIGRGRSLTVTDPEARRSFIAASEAVELALHVAASGEGGTFTIDMGEPIKIIDIARHLINLAGLAPGEDIGIQFAGLRGDEKLEEDRCAAGETLGASGVPGVLRVVPAGDLPATVLTDALKLEGLAVERRPEALLDQLRVFVGPLLRRTAPAPAKPIKAASHPVTDGPQPATPSSHYQCRRCGSSKLHRSKARNLRERAFRRITSRRLFRCSDCGLRAWLEPVDAVHPWQRDDADALDLEALDKTVRHL